MITFVWLEPYSETYILIVAESVEDAREKYAVETPTIFNARASNQTHKHDIVFNTLPIEISESTCVVVGK